MKGLSGFLAICLLFCLFFAPAARAEDTGAVLACLNVGKADCLLLMTGGQAFLIDAGYDYTYPALKTALAHYGIDCLDGVILTHTHADHAGGLTALAQSDIGVGAWYASEIYYEKSADEHPLALAAALRGDTVRFLAAGETLAAGDGVLTVLGPYAEDTENENNNSLVLRFDSPDGSMLLAGDMKSDEEAELLWRGVLAPADVLKVGHHGDSGASTAAFLRAVAPKIAVISTRTVEETDTPAPSTLYRLKSYGAEIYLTDYAENAVEVELKSGAVSTQYAAWAELPAKITGISLRIDTANDLLTVKNESQTDAVLSDFTLVSVRGSEWFLLPEIVIPAGGEYLIGTKTTDIAYDFRLPDKRVWHKSKRDAALLLDGCGRLIAVTENGLPE